MANFQLKAKEIGDANIGSSPALVESLFLSIDPQRVLPGDFFRHQELNGTGEDDDDFQTLYLGL